MLLGGLRYGKLYTSCLAAVVHKFVLQTRGAAVVVSVGARAAALGEPVGCFTKIRTTAVPSKKSRLFFTTIFTQFSSNAHQVLI